MTAESDLRIMVAMETLLLGKYAWVLVTHLNGQGKGGFSAVVNDEFLT